MPAGQYRLITDGGEPLGFEAFRSAPGPVGWRYFSTTTLLDGGTGNVDLSVNAAWEPMRVRIQNSAHHTLLLPRGETLQGILDEDELSIPFDRDRSIEYPSPAFLAAAARRFGDTAEVEALAIDPVTLQTRAETHRYENVGPEAIDTAAGTFDAEHWRFIAPRPRFSRSFWVAGDVCVAAEDLYELVSYEALSNGPRPRPG